jgi:GDP-L-fucose synthase
MMELTSKIYVAGHRGLVGGAILRRLQSLGYTNIVQRTHAELDLLNQAAVRDFFRIEQPNYVFMAAAKVGGIVANNKLLFLGSSCIYPKLCPQPITEDYLLTGPLEPTNEPYAVAKIAGIKMCQAYNEQYGTNYISVMPTNLYGPGDNFDLQTSHVLPALIRKFFEATQQGTPNVTVWGTGQPRRELMYVEDLADAVVHLMNTFDGSQIVNIGTGRDHSIAEIAQFVQQAVGYSGDIVFDPTKPDGTPQKLLDVSRLRSLGWEATTPLADGIAKTLTWYQDHHA